MRLAWALVCAVGAAVFAWQSLQPGISWFVGLVEVACAGVLAILAVGWIIRYERHP